MDHNKKRNIFKITTLIFVPIIFLGLLELILSISGVSSVYEREDPFLGFQSTSSLYVEAASPKHQTIYSTRKNKLEWFNFQQFICPKPDNVYRIFCFGGSTTYGRPYVHKTSFSNWLELILNDMSHNERYEVINAGGISYASYRIVNLIKEIVQYQPDLFIIYTGHNEFLERRTYEELLAENPIITKTRIQLNKLKTYSLARKLWMYNKEKKQRQRENKFMMTGEVNAILDLSAGLNLYRRDPKQRENIIRHFGYNLKQMIQIANQHHIKVIFVQPPTNIKDFSPFKSQLSNALTIQQKIKWQKLFRSGVELMEMGKFDQALSYFLQNDQLDSEYAQLNFYKGKCYLALADFDKAKIEFIRARDFDVAPLRATSEITNIIHNVCESHHVPVLDLISILEQRNKLLTGHTILGKELFLDHAHPTIEVHQLIAEQIVDLMIRENITQQKPNWKNSRLAVVYDSVMATIDQDYYAMRDLNLAKLLYWTGKKKEATPLAVHAVKSLPQNPDAHYTLGLIYSEQKLYEDAVAAFLKAIELDSVFVKPYHSLGIVYDKLGLIEQAIKVQRQAISIDSSFATPYYSLGLLYKKQGLFDKAILAYNKAIYLKPGFSSAHYNLGNIYQQQGELDRAIESYRAAIKIDPNHINASMNLGAVYFRQGAYEKAENTFKELLKIYPDNFRTYTNLGVIYRSQGKQNLAKQMFQQALAINPDDQLARQALTKLSQ